MSSSRHLGRVIVLQTLFAYEFTAKDGKRRSDPEALLLYVAREFEGESKSTLSPSTLAFAYELLNGVLNKLPAILPFIEHHAPQWPVEKIAAIDRAALEIAIYEMKYSKDVPPVVAIDEAIELAKTFGNENSPKFVNGVLNAILESTKR